MASTIERFRTVRKRAFPLIIGTTLGVIAACGGDSEQATTGNLGSKTPNSNPGDSQAVPSLPSSEVLLTQMPTSIESEILDSESAILNSGDWQMAVVGWEEVDSFEYDVPISTDPEFLENSKYIAVNAVVRNVSNQVVNTDDLHAQAANINLVDSSGEPAHLSYVYLYPDLGLGILEAPYIRQPNKKPIAIPAFRGTSFDVPPGFGFEMGMTFLVPKDWNDYGLTLENSAGGQMVNRGSVALGYKTIGENVQISPVDSAFNYDRGPDHSFRFWLGPFLPNEQTPMATLQQLGLNVQNVSGEYSPSPDLVVGGDDNADIQFMLFLKDGTLVPSIYGDGVNQFLDPGESEQLEISIASSDHFFVGTSPWSHPSLYRLFDRSELEGAVVLLVGTKTKSWIAWQLP